MPFVVGKAEGINPAHVDHSFRDEADPPGVAGQWKLLRLRFLSDGFGDGDLLAFAVDRDEADAVGPAGAVAGGSADLLGDGVLLPSGEILRQGRASLASTRAGRSSAAGSPTRSGGATVRWTATASSTPKRR